MTPSDKSGIDQAREARWAALQESRRLYTVELEPVRPVIHIMPCCAPDCDRIMLNTYQRSHFLTSAEARALALELNRAASITDAGVAAWPYLVVTE